MRKEFRVFAWRPAGGMERNGIHQSSLRGPVRIPSKMQDEESTHIYITGIGETLEDCQEDALDSGRGFLEVLGYDRFLLMPTIADSTATVEPIDNYIIPEPEEETSP